MCQGYRSFLFQISFLTYIPHNASQLPPVPACTAWWAWHWSSPAQVSETIPNAACDPGLWRPCYRHTASVVFPRWGKDWPAPRHCENESECVVVVTRPALLASHVGNTGVRTAPGAWYGWERKARYFYDAFMACRILFQVNSLDIINAILRRLDSLPSRGQTFLLERMRPVCSLGVVINVVFSTTEREVDRPSRRQRQFVLLLFTPRTRSFRIASTVTSTENRWNSMFSTSIRCRNEFLRLFA